MRRATTFLDELLSCVFGYLCLVAELALSCLELFARVGGVLLALWLLFMTFAVVTASCP